MNTGPTIDPERQRTLDDNIELHQLKRLILDSTDAFGKLVADATENELDIATQYDFSPERGRLFRNGSRAFPHYNTVSQFSDDADVWTLQPDAGDRMHIRSAESVTYTVNYVLQLSQAFELNQSLTNGDVLRWAAYNGTDGWVAEQRGADHADDQIDVIESRGGAETTLATDVTLAQPVTDWTRYELRYNWYNVGNQRWVQTYTDDGTQVNSELVTTSNDGERGPETANLNIWWEIQAADTTTNLELRVGSGGAITLGSPQSLTRDKTQLVQVTVEGTNGAWEPVYAIRLAPDNPNVNAAFSQLDVLDYAASADLELVVASVAASKTDASGWSVPEYHHAASSAIESTTNISEVPNGSGVQTDLGTSEEFGGHTVATAAKIDGGIGSESVGTANPVRQEKKAVLGSDVLVVLARTDSTGSQLSFVWGVDQNW
jgi:hypothetical protein